MARIWYCPNCGYEVRGRGRCHACREKLVASDLPELEPGNEDDEVGYRLGGWRDRDRGRLIEFLNSLQIIHRFEEDELVIAAEDEERVDDLVAELMATASHDDAAYDDDDDFAELDGLDIDGSHPGTSDENVVEAVALLADAARRLRADPTDMQADADVAEASTAVFLTENFGGVDEETWAAVGRVTRRLLSALGADEALEEEIRLQAGVLAKLLPVKGSSSEAASSSTPAPGPSPLGPSPLGPSPSGMRPSGLSPLGVPSTDEQSDAAPSETAHSVEGQSAGRQFDEGQSVAGQSVAGQSVGTSSDTGRLAVGTVYELTEWLPEQRAHLSVLLDDNKIAHEWDADDLVVDSSRESEAEALFSLVGGVDPVEDDDEDEERYHAIEELFNATSRLASAPDDLERRGDALAWAEDVDGPAPVGIDEVFWLRVVKNIHALTAAIESEEGDEDVIATEAGTLHDLLRTIV